MENLLTAKQEKFIDESQIMTKGKYHLTLLAMLRLVGGKALHSQARALVNRENYLIDELYPLKESITMMKCGMEHGLSLNRLGNMVADTLKRSEPQMFEGATPNQVLDIMERIFSGETDEVKGYKGTVRLKEQDEKGAIIERIDIPTPCDYFSGLIEGLFKSAGISVKVVEVQCQWKEDKPSCHYKVDWSAGP